jgi:deazaflavin-dependent oxidoreductase (nitroreductase family)
MPNWLGFLLWIGFITVAATAFVRTVFFNEAGRRRLLPFLRPVFRLVNPRMVRAAARRETSYGVVHHVGRRSGAAYDTPVDATRTPEGVLIVLPYGPVTDWCRNVLAAGHCTLTLDGDQLALTAPGVIPANVAEPLLPAAVARRAHRLGIAHYLSLKNAPHPRHLGDARPAAFVTR